MSKIKETKKINSPRDFITSDFEQDWSGNKEQSIHNHNYYIKHTRRFSFGKLAFGLTLICLGLLYLSINLGWLPPEFKPDLWNLWPLLIVFAGLSMITGQGLASFLVGATITLTTLALATLLIISAVGKANYTNSTIATPANTCNNPITDILK